MNAPSQLQPKPAASKTAAREMQARGMEFHRAGNLAEAALCYADALRADSRNGDALHLLGLVNAAEGRIERGIELIQQAVKAQPRFAAAFFNLGNLLRKQARLQAAVTAYQRATSLQPKFPEAYCNLGCTLDALGRLPEAVTALRRAIADNRAYAEAHRNLGLIQQKQGRLDEAALALHRAVELAPDHPTAPRELAVILQAQGNFAEAGVLFARFAALDPCDAHLQLALGTCLHAEGKLPEAIDAYHRARALQPQFAEALALLRETIDTNVGKEAVWRAQRDAIALKTEGSQTLDHLGSAFLLSGRITEALETWRPLSPLQIPPQGTRTHEPATTASNRLHTTLLETPQLQLALEFKIFVFTSAATVTLCAPAFSLITIAASEPDALRDLDLLILQKAAGPLPAAPRDDRPAFVSLGHSSDTTRRAVRETIHERPRDLLLFAQQLRSANRLREALECLRESARLGLEQKHFCSFHGLLAAVFGCFDEAIALYLKAVIAHMDLLGASREPFHPLATLLADASALTGAPPSTARITEFGDAPVPLPTELLRIEACNYLAEDLLNYHNNLAAARAVYLRRDQFQQDWLRASGIGPVDTLFLGFDWVRNVGHIAFLGHLIKLRELGLSPWRHIVVLVRENQPANLAYLNQWRKHLTVVSHPAQIARFLPLTIACGFRFSTLFRLPGRAPLYNSELAQAVEEKWEAAGRAPLLTLDASDQDAGWHALAAFGVKKGDWFVALHVRESGFHQVEDAHRNASLDNYLTAIKTITKRGGWVIRMGDATMSPLPPMDRVIDYPHTPLKSPAMDVFLCAECRFFIGLHSGLSHVPSSFGRPTVMTNWLNTGSLPPFPRGGIFLPKLIRDIAGRRLLPLAESLGTQWGERCYGACKLADHGAELIDNTAAEINEIVLEMLARLDGTHTPSEEDAALQKKFSALFPGDSARGLARPGAAFLRRHRALL